MALGITVLLFSVFDTFIAPHKKAKKMKPIKMKHTQITLQNQTVSAEKVGIPANIFSEFKIGSMLNAAGITKTQGAGPLAIFTIIFNLAFTGKNFFQGVVRDKSIRIGKDAVIAHSSSRFSV